jgi:hypothetical protein
MPTTTLTFTVNQFRSLATAPVQLMLTGAGQSADVNVTVSPPSSYVSVDANGAVTVARNGNIGLQLPLTLEVTGYAALALVFKQTTGGNDPTGAAAFGTYTRGNGNGNNNALMVTDNDFGNATWEFYVLVQNLTTGDFGLIDPKITNQ